MKKIKKLIKLIIIKIQKYVFLKKVCFTIKQFLPNGIYKIVVGPSSLVQYVVSSFPLIKIGAQSNQIHEINKEKKITVAFRKKAIAFIGHKVVSIYKETWKDKLLRINQLLKELPYPKSECLEFSIEKDYIVFERVYGEFKNDKTHIFFLAEEMLRYAIKSVDVQKPSQYNFLDDKTYKHIKYSVQHGDLGNQNILWQDAFKYCLIDFDCIDVFPSLYDFLFILIVNIRGIGIREYVDGRFDKEILEYERVHKINQSIENFKDECLAAFTLVAPQYTKTDLRIRKFVPASYKKTQDALAIKGLFRINNSTIKEGCN